MLLPRGKNEKAIELMKDELGLRAKTCSYLIDDKKKT